jgi:hypothetical protein
MNAWERQQEAKAAAARQRIRESDRRMAAGLCRDCGAPDHGALSCEFVREHGVPSAEVNPAFACPEHPQDRFASDGFLSHD